MVSNNHARLAFAICRRDHALGGAAEIPTTKQMISDIDIWRCAQLMINNYGDEAALEAATTADEWLAKGNIEAQRVWLRIVNAIDALQKAQPGETKQ